MRPRELHHDRRGLSRLERVKLADMLVAKARSIAHAFIADQDRGFAEFADDSCDECSSKDECGYKRYVGLLFDAAEAYAAAGLGLLAHRVKALASNCVTNGWKWFDESNATTGL